MRIARAASRLVASDNDYLSEFCASSILNFFCKAISLKGIKGGFQELSVAMNEMSAVASETRPSLTLPRQQLNKWFLANGDTEISGYTH